MKQLIDNEFYSFLDWQEWPGHEAIGLYNLKIDIEGHPKGSTVADTTLLQSGLAS